MSALLQRLFAHARTTLSPARVRVAVRNFFRPGSHHRWATTVVSLAVGFFAYLIYLATLVAPDIEIVKERFHNLAQSYERGGLQHFLSRKDLLRRDVSRTLRASDSQYAQMIALNISLYLFPELLPKDDFERRVAEESWVAQQRAIERAPGTLESRLKFEEMKANIWNYESPDKASPSVSETAETVLHLYDVLSTK